MTDQRTDGGPSATSEAKRPGWDQVLRDELSYQAEYRVAPPVPMARPFTRPLRRHVLIAGTGRAGTSFLVQLLTDLGLDTGFAGGDLKLYREARAGLERSLLTENAPYIVKSPWIEGPDLHDVLCDGKVALDHAILPMRDLTAAVKSRLYVQEKATGCAAASTEDSVPGGLWNAKTEADQEAFLAHNFTSVIETLIRLDVPIAFLWFPRLINDPTYLFAKLSQIFPGLAREQFLATHRRTARREWVNSFTPGDR